jgi:beta-lactamase superfamily II metal-dependent hydrolase
LFVKSTWMLLAEMKFRLRKPKKQKHMKVNTTSKSSFSTICNFCLSTLASLPIAWLTSTALNPKPAAAALPAVPCSAAGTWTKGEVSLYWFDVEQGDSQLIVGPTGKTLLIDLGETAFNSTGANTKATAIASKIRSICGTGSNPVALDYVMISHLHLDHTGYAAVPGDTTTYGNGLYQLLTPNGLGFTVGSLITRDAGAWVDGNGNNQCEPGNSTTPSTEINWHNVGTLSTTASRLVCWMYGPAGQADRANIQGKVVTLTNSALWPTLDLGNGVTAKILNANGKDTLQANGVTPVSGNHANDPIPPSENDYSIAVKISYGKWSYATAGDSDGEYNTSVNGYTYNNIESKLAPLFGNVDTMRANHHGSGHSSSANYVNILKPETAFISCGDNTFGHPGNRVLNALRNVLNDRGVGADIYLANNPCAITESDGTPINYAGTFNSNGDVVLRTTGSGSGYTVSYNAGTLSYQAYGAPTGGGNADPSQVVINEYLMAPSTGGNEWVELYNPTNSSLNIGGFFIDDIANGGGTPRMIPTGTLIPAKGYYVMEIPSGFLNNTGVEEVRYLMVANGTETVYDKTSYNLSSTQTNKVFHRIGDNGAWCSTVSLNLSKGGANPTSCP